MATINWYSETDLLSQKKQQKKDALSAECNAAILSGFSSSALGAAHTYPSDEEAQRNYHSELDRINLDPTYTTIYFKTLDSGYQAHTVAQFKQVFIDGHISGRQQIAHLNDLKAQVDDPSITTQAQLGPITW